MAAESPPVGASTATAVYGEAAVHLRDFAAKYPVPNLVKVAKGQYRNIGVAKSVCRELYLHSVRTCPKVLAVGVKIKDNRKSGKKVIVASDQKYALPITYQGWWELLSEDGKAIRPISSVAELARIFPTKALVREPIKALTTKEGSNDLTLDRNRMLHSGEQLTLVGDMAVVIGSGKGAVSRRMLRCFDTKGENVYLGLDQKGLFSPIAGQGNISGVHSIHSLTTRFRLPVLVRLVHGIIPLRLERNAFTGVFRLLGLYDDDTAFVMPLKRDAKMVPISTREPLKLVPALNFTSLQDSEDCQHYHQRCGRMIASYLNSIHVLVNPPEIASVHKVNTTADARKSKPPVSKSEEDILFEEVDDIYAYVRDGGAPPPPRPRPPNQRARVDNRRTPSVVQTKPVSPVIREYEGFLAPSAAVSPGGEDRNRKPSASKAVDGTSPYSERRHSDENYWEEPIYDEIERYQRKIQEGHSNQQPVSESMEAIPGRRQPNEGSPAAADRAPQAPIPEQPSEPEGDSRPTNNRLEAVAMRAPSSTDGGGSVQNLRQIYKKDDDSSSGSRHNSLEKSDEDLAAGRQREDTTPPPLPPKLFDFDETEDINQSQSKSLPRPASKSTDVDVPSKSLPKDMFKFTRKSKSPKPAPEPPEPERVHEELKRKDSDSKKKEAAEAKKREAEARKREAEAKKKEAAEAKKKEAEAKKREAEAKKRERRESESKRKDSTESNPITRSIDGFFGLSSRHKGPAPTDPSTPYGGASKMRNGTAIDVGSPSFSASTPRLSSSPEGTSPIYGPPRTKGTHIPMDIPVVDHTGSIRRHSQPMTMTSSPPRTDMTSSSSRRHSTAPTHSSRGTSVAVTLGVSPPNAVEARNAVAGASVKVGGPPGPGSVHNSYHPHPQGALPGTHTQRIALTSKSAHMGHRQPKYVAVARVGDDKAPSAQDKANGSVSNLNRHIQSVHLWKQSL